MYISKILYCISCTKKFFYEWLQTTGIDGCHLKKKNSEVLLVVVASDANKEIVPLAFSICKFKNTERQVTFINDKQKALLNAIPNT